MQEDNILILQMTESEAALLSMDPDISIVEEDILVTANSYELEVINDLEEEDYTGISYGQTIPWNVQAVRGSREDLGVNANQPGIKIGILDSGIEVMTEIDVAERINFTGEDDTGSFASMYEDMTGHGTSVAGVIAAKDDNQGIVGINPNAEIYSLKVFDDKNQAPLSRIIEAIQYAIEQDISILNMSFGTTVNSPALHLKIREAYDADMLLIAAAGNRGMVEYPAAFEEVMAIGGTTMNHQVASFSKEGTPVELLAPGTPVMTTGLLNGYMVVEGTSIAAPHVAAAASLLWAKDPTKSSDFIRQLLNVSARKLEEENAGNGLLDIANAFEIYEEFETIYIPNTISYQEYAGLPENNLELEEFTEDYVVGSWGTTGHDTTITDNGYLTKYVELIKAASEKADSGDYTAKKGRKIDIILHGGTILNESNFSPDDPSVHEGQNYVSDLRYLYQAACDVFKGDPLPSTSIYTGVSKDISTIAQYILDEDLGKGSLEFTKEGKAAKLLGFAIHLAGDVYAHRTLVPISAINSINSNNFLAGSACDTNTIKKQAFLRTIIANPKEPCEKYTCLIKGIQEGVIETKDISTWGGERGTYEDTASFLRQRFEAAKFSVRYIMGRFRYRSTLNNSVFLPDYNGVSFGLDLNGLYKFYKETGWSTTNIPKSPYNNRNDYTNDLY